MIKDTFRYLFVSSYEKKRRIYIQYNNKIFCGKDQFVGRLIIDGNRIYEVDELCLKRKKEQSGAEKNRKPASAQQAGQGNGHMKNKR